MALENKIAWCYATIIMFDVLSVSLEPQEASRIQIRNQNYMHQEK